MSFDYGALATSAQLVIADFGQPVTISTDTLPVYDPVTGTATTTQLDETSVGVITSFESKDVNNTSILQSDKKLILSAIGITQIKSNSSVVIGTEQYSVISISKVAPAGVTVIYELQLRGVQ